MKLKTSVAAVILAFSATGAWAGPTGTDPAKADMGASDASAVQPSSSAAVTGEALEWKFVNGQSATPDQSGNAKGEELGAKDQAATSEEQGDDQSAKSEDQSGGDQSATAEVQREDDTAANSEEQDSDQAAMTEDGEGDKAAAAEGEGDSDQAANAEGQDGEDQSARSEDRNEGGQSANSDNPAADLKDKVVVIIPKDWKGSLPDLIAALEKSPDAKDIVIVQQGEPQASNDEPGDEYEASMKPSINQQ